jgi:hypothetical protein
MISQQLVQAVMEPIHLDRQSGAVGQLVQPQGQMAMFCIIEAQDPLRQTALPLEVLNGFLYAYLVRPQQPRIPYTHEVIAGGGGVVELPM